MNKDNYQEIIDSEGELYEWIRGGLKCFIRRNDMLSWCGYVRVPSYYKIDMGLVPDDDRYYPPFDVHGGVTYNEYDDSGDYVIGFDTGHSGDLCPYYFKEIGMRWAVTGVYRDKNYVINETNSLCDQILETYIGLKSEIRNNIIDSII